MRSDWCWIRLLHPGQYGALTQEHLPSQRGSEKRTSKRRAFTGRLAAGLLPGCFLALAECSVLNIDPSLGGELVTQ